MFITQIGNINGSSLEDLFPFILKYKYMRCGPTKKSLIAPILLTYFLILRANESGVDADNCKCFPG